VSTDPLMGEIAGPGSGPPLSGPGVTAPTLSGAGRRFLSDILVELGFVDETQAEHAVQAARHPGQTPEKVLLESGAITEDQLARALAERYGLDHIDLTEFPVDESAAGLLRKTAAMRYLAAPIGFAADGALVLAVADPADSLGLSDIAVMTKLPVRAAVAARSQIAKLLDTMLFMEEPVQGASQTVSTVIVPPDGDGAEEPAAPASGADDPVERPPAKPAGNEATERELSRLREELAMALVARDEAMAKLAAHGEETAAAAEREREEAASRLRLEHERELAAAEAAAEGRSGPSARARSRPCRPCARTMRRRSRPCARSTTRPWRPSGRSGSPRSRPSASARRRRSTPSAGATRRSSRPCVSG
jgi:hypothetical protein